MIVMVVSAALVITLGGLFCFHSYVMLCNLSTLEMDQLKPGNPFMHKKRVVLSNSERNKKTSTLNLLFGVTIIK